MPPIAADNKHIQISLDTHIVTLKSILRKAPLADRFVSPYIDDLQLADSNFRAKEHRRRSGLWSFFLCLRILTICNWLILTSGPKNTGGVPVSGHFTSRTRTRTRITAKFSIRLNFPTALYYLNTTHSLDIKRRLRQISYHQAKGQIVISNTNTGGITRVYRDEKLLGFACLLHLGCAF